VVPCSGLFAESGNAGSAGEVTQPIEVSNGAAGAPMGLNDIELLQLTLHEKDKSIQGSFCRIGRPLEFRTLPPFSLH
jgi:hypothetical protein